MAAKKNFTMKNHNGTDWDVLHPKTNMAQVEGLEAKISEVEAVAKGASRAFVFDTAAALDTWLGVAANKNSLQTGDHFYIRAADVPDYWWDGTAKQMLETEKIKLTNATQSADGLMSKGDKTKLDGVATGATKVTAPGDIGAATAAQGAKADTALQSIPFETTAANILVAGTAAAGSSGKVADAAHVHPVQTSVTGNAGTATKLAAAKTFALTGDVTGTVSSDLSGNVSIAATQVANKSNQKVGVSKNSATVTGTRKQINFKDGSNVTVTVADNATNDAVDVTIASTNTTYSDATASAAGLMSASDKSRFDGMTKSATAPKANGTAAVGSETAYAAGDHVHPTQASVATLTTARTIAIGTGATGTATSFNGGANITIPITAINADYITSGTLPAARLGVAVTTVATSAPASLKTGDIWFDLSNS